MSKMMFSFDGHRLEAETNHGLSTVEHINVLSAIIEACRVQANELIAELLDEVATGTEVKSWPNLLDKPQA